MLRNNKAVTAQEYRNNFQEFSKHFVDSKGNRNYKRFAKKQANRAERHGKGFDIAESLSMVEG